MNDSSVRLCLPDSVFQKTQLDNGIRILTERLSYVKSVSVSIYVKSGSRGETTNLNGISHFLEHMFFKGTQSRDALQIAKTVDSVGGNLNAFTSKELTSFYCKMLSKNLTLATDLLTDIFLNSYFPEEEIEREKQVICQEIRQVQDTPEDFIHEMVTERFWPDDPFGRSVLGTMQNVLSFDRDTMLQYMADNYVGAETIVCAAGDVEHEKFVDLIRQKMHGLNRGSTREKQEKPKSFPGVLIREKDLEQVHVCVAVEGPSASDGDRYKAYLLNTLFGGGMSSRLFQEIREKRGLSYSVYSFLTSYSDTGIMGIYASTEPERIEELLDVMGTETLKISDTIRSEELEMAKNQLAGTIILSNESTDSRVSRIVKGEIHFGKYVSLDEIIDDLEKVSLEEVQEFSSRFFRPEKMLITLLGPASESMDVKSFFDGSRI